MDQFVHLTIKKSRRRTKGLATASMLYNDSHLWQFDIIGLLFAPALCSSQHPCDPDDFDEEEW
jgi:hypothetical protein